MTRIRREFPEPVRGFDSRGHPLCVNRNSPIFELVAFPGGGMFAPEIVLPVHKACAEAFRALAVVFKTHNYLFIESAGGTFNCRLITGGGKYATSPHAHGVALDINPSKNGYRRQTGLIQWGRHTDMSREMIRDVEAIKTMSGKNVFRWGGRWWNVKDPMHFEPTLCVRSELETGIDWTTVNGNQGNETNKVNYVKRGDKGPDIVFWQAMLATAGHKPANSGDGSETNPWDGDYGPGMAAAVMNVQGTTTAASREGKDYLGPLTAANIMRLHAKVDTRIQEAEAVASKASDTATDNAVKLSAIGRLLK